MSNRAQMKVVGTLYTTPDGSMLTDEIATYGFRHDLERWWHPAFTDPRTQALCHRVTFALKDKDVDALLKTGVLAEASPGVAYLENYDPCSECNSEYDFCIDCPEYPCCDC